MAYSIESFFRVYDDSNGSYWEIRPDVDALGCVEVRCYENGKLHPNQQLIAPPAAMQLIAKAMAAVADSMVKEGY